jgi:hypothetical protein
LPHYCTQLQTGEACLIITVEDWIILYYILSTAFYWILILCIDSSFYFCSCINDCRISIDYCLKFLSVLYKQSTVRLKFEHNPSITVYFTWEF